MGVRVMSGVAAHELGMETLDERSSANLGE